MDTKDNTRDIAENIFTNQVKEKCSIQLQLDEFIDDNELQSMLSMITAHGVAILYHPKNIFQLDATEFARLQEYVNSFGYEMVKKRINNDNGTTTVRYIFNKVY